MSHLKNLLKNNQVRYVCTGGGSFIVEYALFLGLVQVGVNLFVANSVSFVVALLLSFLLHRYWSFKGEHRLDRKYQLTSYAVLALANLSLTNIVIGVLALTIPAFVAKILTMMAMVTWNYFILNRLIFRRVHS